MIIEHTIEPRTTYMKWIGWLIEHVGEQDIDWSWDDFSGHMFIKFERDEDATAFKLKFPKITFADKYEL